MSISPLLIACDFDGTVTQHDTLVEILNRYGSPQWHEVQEKVVSGELSIREGLQMEMSSVRATERELKELLADRIQIEPSFPPFLQEMRRKGIPLILLTGGFDLCVEPVLSKAGLWPLPYLANSLKKTNGSPGPTNGLNAARPGDSPERRAGGAGWRVEFPYPSVRCSTCGHCKADPIRIWNAQGYTTLFIGNGVTDRCAAQAASLTFAKEELFLWCTKQELPVVPFQSFSDVQKELARREWL